MRSGANSVDTPERAYAIAALHDEAPSTEATEMLAHGDNPMVRLSRAIALGMADGPRAGLEALDEVARDPRMAKSYRLDAARAHLLERAGDHAEAIRYFRLAAERTASTPERNYLMLHAARLADR